MAAPHLHIHCATSVLADAADLAPRTAANAQARPAKGGLYRRMFKRAFDVSAVILSAPIVVPIVAALAVAVSRDGGKAFYTQQRVGQKGRIFRMWKLRSMVPDADARMLQYLAENPAARAEWDVTQKLRNDPRVTPLVLSCVKAAWMSCRNSGMC